MIARLDGPSAYLQVLLPGLPLQLFEQHSLLLLHEAPTGARSQLEPQPSSLVPLQLSSMPLQLESLAAATPGGQLSTTEPPTHELDLISRNVHLQELLGGHELRRHGRNVGGLGGHRN